MRAPRLCAACCTLRVVDGCSTAPRAAACLVAPPPLVAPPLAPLAARSSLAPHPPLVVALATRVSQPALVRAGVELNSEKVGEVAPGTLVSILEERENADGSKRACFALENDVEQHGWITSITASGVTNLKTMTRPLVEVIAAKALQVGCADAHTDARCERGSPPRGVHACARSLGSGSCACARAWRPDTRAAWPRAVRTSYRSYRAHARGVV
jgi:hypothetical protein